MAPLFSIVIPAYNEEKYIRKTLQSIKSQTFRDFEIIVVANGCTDKTEEIVKKRANSDLRLLSLPKANVSVARNAGALNANGNVLVFVDADTTLEADSLKKIKDEFTPEYAVATTLVKPDLEKIKYRAALSFKNFYNKTKLYQGCSGVLICRKDDFKAVQGYDPSIVVKEHKKLITKLHQRGKYRCVNTEATNSMRRFEQWGLGKATSFWISQWLKDKFSNVKNSEYETIR